MVSPKGLLWRRQGGLQRAGTSSWPGRLLARLSPRWRVEHVMLRAAQLLGASSPSGLRALLAARPLAALLDAGLVGIAQVRRGVLRHALPATYKKL